MEREEVEKLTGDIRRQRDEAETEAAHARDGLARLASGMMPLREIDADQVEAAADDYASAVRKLRMLDEFGAKLRGLLM